MIGLEYILKLYDMKQQELSDNLEIKQQNIDSWIKGKRKIPRKHLPKLSKIFKLPEEYFQKELTDIDTLIIQKEKLKKELKPKIKEYETRLVLSDNPEETDLDEFPVYDKRELNDLNIEISKVKVIEEIRKVVSSINTDYEIYMIEQIAKLIKRYGDKKVFIDTIEALSHYYNILPDWVGELESIEFVEEFLELAERHERGEVN